MIARTLFPLLAGLALARPLCAQGVLVAPHAVAMDHRTRSGEITLYNPSTAPTEVSITTLYGYPVTDSTGNYQLYTLDTPDSTQPSAAGWIEAFPRRMTLGPGERQTVRLLGRPPAGLPAGEYWTRLVIAARGGQAPVTAVGPDTAGINVGLSLEVRTIIPVLYRKGLVQTSVRVSDPRLEVDADSLVLRVHLAREGNAAYVGSLTGALTDSAGHAVATINDPVAVYYQIDPRISAPVPPLGPGRYTLRFAVSTEREDMSRASLLQAPPVRDSVELRVP